MHYFYRRQDAFRQNSNKFGFVLNFHYLCRVKMLQFKPIQLSDKQAIDACLAENIYRASDYCFANLFAWQKMFNTNFAIEQDTLFVRFKNTIGKCSYLFPIGKMPLEQAVSLIIADTKSNSCDCSFEMRAVTERMWDALEAAMPNVFQFTHDRATDEYIYTSEKLIGLVGKKLQSKRNHINRFKKDHPDWEYFKLSHPDDLRECAEMLDLWENLNHNDAELTLRYDYLATKLMLKHFHELNLRGGYIRVNGKIIAFTIGEPLVKDTFAVHVEKAYAEMNGAYTIINQQFVENEAADFRYINREEDMGLENLRRAKESYYPDILLQERTVTLK